MLFHYRQQQFVCLFVTFFFVNLPNLKLLFQTDNYNQNIHNVLYQNVICTLKNIRLFNIHKYFRMSSSNVNYFEHAKMMYLLLHRDTA